MVWLLLTYPGGDGSYPITLDNEQLWMGIPNLISFNGAAGPWGTMLSGFPGNY